jgi:hypothetical protein
MKLKEKIKEFFLEKKNCTVVVKHGYMGYGVYEISPLGKEKFMKRLPERTKIKRTS